MARPRTIDADSIQTFHCSFVLRVALQKSAGAKPGTNVSHFIRTSLDEACKNALGPALWHQLQRAASRPFRRSLLDAFLAKLDLTRIRRGVDASRARNSREKTDAVVFRAIDDYLALFQSARDDRKVDLALCVALEEAIDTIQKVKTILRRPSIAHGAWELLQRLTARFPDHLRADFDSAIVSRMVTGQKEPKKTG